MPHPSVAPELYVPGDSIPVPLDLEALLGLTEDDPDLSPEMRAMREAFRAEFAPHPALPRELRIRMPKPSDIQRILREREYATDALVGRSYDMDPAEYAAQRVALEDRYQQAILAYVEPLPAGTPWSAPEDLPALIIKHLWETILFYSGGLTRKEAQGSTGRSGSGSPGPETTTASARVVAVQGDTTPPPTKKRSTR